MPDQITAKTGNAPIKKLGHTSTNRFGLNPHVKDSNRTPPRDEAAK
jgi:hypothetical protein